MSDLHQRRLARWQRIKERGIWRFIVARGVLGWGLPFGVGFCLIRRWQSESPPLLWYWDLALSCGLGMFGGVLFGASMWWFTMWSYSRALSRRP